jgi:hypothetical protein
MKVHFKICNHDSCLELASLGGMDQTARDDCLKKRAVV